MQYKQPGPLPLEKVGGAPPSPQENPPFCFWCLSFVSYLLIQLISLFNKRTEIDTVYCISRSRGIYSI